MVPCDIPYIYGTLHGTDKNVIPDANLLDANIHLVIDEVKDRCYQRLLNQGIRKNAAAMNAIAANCAHLNAGLEI